MDEATPIDTTRLILGLPLGCLPASALVDALHLAAGLKRVMRTVLAPGADVASVLDWCRAARLSGRVDDAGFFFAGLTASDVEHALSLDTSADPHELSFGTLLGYPLCCCRAVAAVGEQSIDVYGTVVGGWAFAGDYRLIDPTGYSKGQSLICHLPCSPACTPSLHLALRVTDFLATRSPLMECEACRRLQGWVRGRSGLGWSS